MPRNLKIVLGILGVAVLIGLISLRDLHERVRRLSENQNAEEQARREVLAPPISTPTDVNVQAKIFWAAGPDKVAPVIVELPLSADAVQRSRQVLEELISSPPTPEQRTLPADATILGFYILRDGTAIADFSDALVTETPSGISSEATTIASITGTLENNVPSLKRLKILIHGQEVDTLAGHVDLTGFFDLNPPAPQPVATPAHGDAAPAAPAPAAVTSTPPRSAEILRQLRELTLTASVGRLGFHSSCQSHVPMKGASFAS
ncbi:MAG TPA: GerMN domain-containing protein [Candidatus Acidoferrum sp.]|nr:GerMN domain-containing protein [Candidatus Acidoferrum sp.]